MTRELVSAMTAAADAFLASLTDEQRRAVQWPFPSDEERRRWYYTPTDHGGLTIAMMAPSQVRLFLKLLRCGLSRPGFVTAMTIMGNDNILDELEGWTMTWGHDRGRDPSRYYVRIFGEPSVDSASSWGWRFGGHHLSVNFSVVNGQLLGFTPCFFGADPAESPLLGGHLFRPLGAVEDLGRELLNSLDPDQRQQAVLSANAPSDLVTANRPMLRDGDQSLPLRDVWRGYFDGELDQFLIKAQTSMDERFETTPQVRHDLRFTTTPRGVRVAMFRPEQKTLLRRLLETYVGRVAEPIAESEMQKWHGSAVDELSFAWAGGSEVGQPHYYRVHGPTLLAEYDNAARSANHIHSVWRDPRGDFGDVLGEHLRADHASG